MLYDLDDDIERYTTMRDELQTEIDAALQQHAQICRVLAALQGKADVPEGWTPIVVDVTPAFAAAAFTHAKPKLAAVPEPKKRDRSDVIKHGTTAGYAKCKKRAEGSCQPCKDANRAYQREWARQKAEAVALGAAPFDPDKAREAAAVTAARDTGYSIAATGYEPHQPPPPASPAKPTFSTEDALAVLNG